MDGHVCVHTQLPASVNAVLAVQPFIFHLLIRVSDKTLLQPTGPFWMKSFTENGYIDPTTVFRES